MKRLFSSVLWIISIVLVSNCAGPQQTTSVNDSLAPMNTNSIVVETNISDEEAYLYIADILLKKGYTIRYSDMTLKSISTEFTGIAQRWGVDHTFVRIGINVQGESNAKIILRGWMRTVDDSDDQTGFRISKTGQNGSPIRNAWAELFSLASEINGKMVFE